jgi:hypothetical protein
MVKCLKGKIYSNKQKLVYVASGNNGCPTLSLANSTQSAKMRDDFSKGIKISKNFAKIIFK